MKLPTSVLEFELNKFFIIERNVHASNTGSYESPYLYSISASQWSRIYVLPAGTALPARIPEDSLLICCRDADSGLIASAAYPILHTSAFETAELLNAVQSVFDKYNNWIKGMNDLLTEWRNPLQSILNLCAEVHNNMFMVQDAGFRTVAVAWSGEFGASKEWNAEVVKSSLGTQMPPKIMSLIREHFPTRRETRKAMYHSFTDAETIDIPLFNGSIYLGMLSMLQYNRDFDSHDYSILEILSGYIAHVLSVESALKADDTGELGAVFSQLINGKYIEKETVENICKTVGFHTDDSFVVAAISFPSEESAAYINYVQQDIASNIEGSLCCRKDQFLAVIINTSLRANMKGAWMDMISRCSSEFSLKAGLSDSFSGFNRCMAYFTEAAAAIAFSPSAGESGICRFSDIRIKYAIKNSTGELKPEMLYTDGFRRLLEYEKTAGVSYIETLRVLLEEGMSASRAARRLYISRNTLLARYDRLKAVLQENLDDPDVRFGLELSLRLYFSII